MTAPNRIQFSYAELDMLAVMLSDRIRELESKWAGSEVVALEMEKDLRVLKCALARVRNA